MVQNWCFLTITNFKIKSYLIMTLNIISNCAVLF